MATASINTHAAGNGFLTSFNSTTPKLYIIAETDTAAEFDQRTLQQWRAEGFDVTYLPYHSSATERSFSEQQLRALAQSTSLGDKFGVVCYGEAASVCLEHFSRAASAARCCCVVAYYPSTVPDPQLTFPIGVKVLVHLARRQDVGVRRRREVLGIQGRKTVTMKSVPQGRGVGGMLMAGNGNGNGSNKARNAGGGVAFKWPAYVYEEVDAGFAEGDLDEFDGVASGLAWSRSLDCVRKAFGVVGDLESVWEENCNAKYKTGNVDKLMDTLTERPSVNFAPVLVGGNDHNELRRFYEEYFLPDTPPSFRHKLISRTIGSDQIVDELVINFDHTQEISWMLPCIPATNKHVEIPIVVIVSIRGGKIHRESTYWDQASVLVQIGLLDGNRISPSMKKSGVKKLPISGAEAAQRAVDRSIPSNEMLDDW